VRLIAPLSAVLVLVALAACGSDDPRSAATPADYERALAGAPPRLARLYSRPNELLGGGPPAFERTLRGLRGHPVVVNKWASWCGPCRFEFPFFQKQAVKRGKEVAFLGVNSQDNKGDAEDFLDEYPLPFPSYEDGNGDVARKLRIVGLPATAYYDRKGELAYLHQGGYASEQKLAEDIERYAR
jgi:cytochrome c biogenesis protein CcmG, thiol:disulfide interchange protein DsbE